MEIVEYKCPGCSAPLVFDSATQNMKCNSCQNEFDVTAVKQYNEAIQAAEQATSGWGTYNNSGWAAEEQHALSGSVCQSCGGELITDANTVATECPYCGNAAVIPQQVSNTLRPDYVIPFKLDKNAAKEALKGFYKKKYLLPNCFKDENRIDKITGTYVPYWLFSCGTINFGTFDATRVQSWTSGNYQFTKTEHYLVTRNGNIDFELVPADGSEKMDDTFMEAIEPFHYDELTTFAVPYLSGYLADKYDVDAEALKPRVDDRIKKTIVSELQSTVHGYATVAPRNVNMNITDGDIKYALFPVWILNTKYKDKKYTFMMNGQTGKLVGSLPVDRRKAAIWFGSIFAGLGTVLSLISLLF